MSDAAHILALTQASEAQALAANPNRSAFATANAGSGKTKVLIDRVARLLLRRPDAVIVDDTWFAGLKRVIFHLPRLL